MNNPNITQQGTINPKSYSVSITSVMIADNPLPPQLRNFLIYLFPILYTLWQNTKSILVIITVIKKEARDLSNSFV